MKLQARGESARTEQVLLSSFLSIAYCGNYCKFFNQFSSPSLLKMLCQISYILFLYAGHNFPQ